MYKYFLSLIIICFPLTTLSATKEEMEHARALVAKWAVRSQNTGSEYLNGTNPKNLDQVKASVKTHSTDLNNLNKLNLTMPSEEDYQSWDNAAMTDYWVKQYNSNVGNNKEESYCRTKLKKDLSSLSATVKTPAPTPKPDENTGNTQEPTNDETVIEEEVVETDDQDGLAADLVEAAAPDPEVEPVAEPLPGTVRETASGSRQLNNNSGSNVWVIIMLVVLVLIVLALVGYASQVMAKTNKRAQGNPRRKHENGRSRDNREEEYDDEDIEEEEQERIPQRHSAPKNMAEVTSAVQPRRPNPSHRATSARISKPRIIYLSNANSEGVFLRAEAQYNMGNSIFKLVTSDGYSGTFSVIDDPAVHEMALMMPVDFLINACSGRNLQLSEGARSIVTDSTGTAIFEDGRWRVARKAQIHYSR